MGVLFYTDECEVCRRMAPGLDTLACKLKGRSNVARVNKETYGEKTGRRFGLGLDNKPAIIYFRLGKMYRYVLEIRSRVDDELREWILQELSCRVHTAS